jgi:ATP-dependent DNA ligase
MDSASAAAYVVFDLLARNGKDLRNRACHDFRVIHG